MKTFEKRNDKYFFHKLSKRRDVVDYLVANFLYNDSPTWIGDFINNEQSDRQYLKLVKVQNWRVDVRLVRHCVAVVTFTCVPA
jgi:hypothetical protein